VHRWFRRERSPALLNWDTGEGKSYWIPALEITGFVFSLNQVNRHLLGGSDYDTDFDSFERNLKTAPVYDKDPFSVNQNRPSLPGRYLLRLRTLGRAPVLGIAALHAGRQLLWETFGETTPPSINDYVSTTIGGSFVGEALFRMAGLLLEGGGERPGSGGSSAPR